MIKRARHHHALPLAAAELVRIAAQRLFRAQPDRLERLLDHVPLLLLRLGKLQIVDRHREHMVDLVERVVDLERVLEDHLDIGEKGARLRLGQLAQVLTLVEDDAAGWVGDAEQ